MIPIDRLRHKKVVGIHLANLSSLDEIMADTDFGQHCKCMEGKLDGGGTMPC